MRGFVNEREFASILYVNREIYCCHHSTSNRDLNITNPYAMI